MRGVAASPDAPVDARSERRREHRRRVRAEIVEAAFRAMDRHGPRVSLREIATEAGTAKPKIYRHFTDKADLFHAIAGRLRDLLWAEILTNVDFAADPAREVLRRSVAEYVGLSDRHPNVLRFVLAGGFAGPSTPSALALPEGHEITMAIAQMFSHELRGLHPDPAVLELAAAAAFGVASAATEWWLGPEADSPRRMPSGDFVVHLTTIMLGTVRGTADLLGVDLDPARPIGAAVPNGAAVR